MWKRPFWNTSHNPIFLGDNNIPHHGPTWEPIQQVQTYGPDVDLALVKIEDSVEEDFWVPCHVPTVVGCSGLGGGEWWG